MQKPPTISVPAPEPHRPTPPEFFRLPRTGERDPYFGCSRAWYLQCEREGLLKLNRVCQPGKPRGIVLVAYDAMVALIKNARGE